MGNRLNEVLEPLKVDNDDLPQNENKSDLNRNYEGDFNESIEPSYLEWDIRYYADPPENEIEKLLNNED